MLVNERGPSVKKSSVLQMFSRPPQVLLLIRPCPSRQFFRQRNVQNLHHLHFLRYPTRFPLVLMLPQGFLVKAADPILKECLHLDLNRFRVPMLLTLQLFKKHLQWSILRTVMQSYNSIKEIQFLLLLLLILQHTLQSRDISCLQVRDHILLKEILHMLGRLPIA